MDVLQYQFYQYALWAALLVSLSCGIIGTYITARRMVFLSGGITHASFGGIGLAYFLGMNPMVGAIIFALLSAFGIEVLSKKADIRQDSAIGILWTIGMAIGIVFIFLTPGYASNLMSFLFGSILTVSLQDLLLMGLITFTLFLIFLILFKQILFIAFDEEYASTHKIRVKLLNYLMISLVSLTIVIGIRVVGVIMVISMLTIPQAIAGLFTNRFGKMILWSILFAFIGSVIGLYVSYAVNIPSGATIILTLAAIYLIIKLLKLSLGTFQTK
ncbi:MAG: metal ABC transporter permease [Bacteroidetes bacterium]|nr:metal ABC transporter permease [Bacteroidota bacterium]